MSSEFNNPEGILEQQLPWRFSVKAHALGLSWQTERHDLRHSICNGRQLWWSLCQVYSILVFWSLCEVAALGSFHAKFEERVVHLKLLRG